MPRRLLLPVLLLGVALWAPAVWGAPAADLWPRWTAHDAASGLAVDHGAWSAFLGRYLVTAHPSGINRLRYEDVTPADRAGLAAYLDRLQAVPISRYRRPEQRAYWINLYNALTVRVVLDHLPVLTIRDIDISPGWFSDGPWDASLARVEGEPLTLNDIEHRILRPIWRDPRLHYAVNCASLGCPNLAPTAYTAANSEALLEQAARAYVNHPRGAAFRDGDLVVSSIYRWFQEDFGGSEAGVLRHLRRYAAGRLAERLRDHRGGLDHAYDWTLNAP